MSRASRRGVRLIEYKGAAVREREQTAFVLSQFKTLSDNAGTFEGYVAVFNNLDGNGDVIERGAFKRTLNAAREEKQNSHGQYMFPLLWQHDEHEPIGGITDATEDDHGLRIKGEYDLDTQRGREAYSGAKKGYLRGLSIGYRTVKSVAQAGARHLLEIQLFEGSPVTFPANILAGITDVKTATGKTDWPLGDRSATWDGGAATKAIGDWAGGDASKLASVFFYRDPEADPTTLAAYKLPFCTVSGGKPEANWGAITACAGSHGIESLKGVPDGDITAIKGKLGTYYNKARKQYSDDTIAVPWEGKALDVRLSTKTLGGLGALVGSAGTLSSASASMYSFVETLAQACGMSLDEGNTVAKPSGAVAAVLGGLDGAEGAIKGVMAAYLEFAQQIKALQAVLGTPDYDGDEMPVSMYMSQLRNAFELKVGRQLSLSNRQVLEKHVAAVTSSLNEVKAMMKSADNPLGAENDQSDDYGDYIASGAHNKPGKALNRDSEHTATTPNDATGDPDILSTLQGWDTDLLSLQIAGLK